MPNMSLKKTPMPEQAPDIRNKNFLEVPLGYTEEMAMQEADRCLNCKHRPCVNGCPVNVQIPDFLQLAKDGKFEEAYQVIKQTSSLPAVCGRVCPQESQCEAHCVRGIKGEPVGIGRLEMFVSDWHIRNQEDHIERPVSNHIKVAVIGAGPSGITCAYDLAKQGYEVTLFESFHVAGGVLVYGIPEFRLPKAIVEREIDVLKKLGVQVMTNMVIGKVLSIEDLKEQGFESIYIGSGAGLPAFMGIPGEGLAGVYSANEYLTRINLMKAYNPEYETPYRESGRVAIVGGGNVAMDAARCAKRLGAEHVYIIYRRSEEEMPARKEESHHAKEEGIEFMTLTAPVQILGNEDGTVKGMECVKMELTEPDESGRRRPVEIPGSNFQVDLDAVIISIGTSPNPLIRNTTQGLETNKKGCFIVDDSLQTTVEGIYAGGDAVTGAATVILAMGAGKQAAASMDAYLKAKYNR